MGLRLCVCVWILNYKKSDSINKRGESALDTVELSAPVDGAEETGGNGLISSSDGVICDV